MADSPERWCWRITIETEKPSRAQPTRFWALLGIMLGILGIVTTLAVGL